MYACGDLIGAQKLVYIEVERCFPHGYRTLYNNMGEYCQWVLAMGVGKGHQCLV